MVDRLDYCILVANPGQTDADGDGRGNACDGDLNQDGFVGGQDFGVLLVLPLVLALRARRRRRQPV